MSKPNYDLRACRLADVVELFRTFHGYKSVGNAATYTFAVFENDKPVAAFVWAPPPPGAARSVCTEAPHAVLALSRMVAVPKTQRILKHISKPLRHQMTHMIDRTRWPVLITFHDEGQGHNGFVYKCSGWTQTTRTRRPIYTNDKGERASSYSNGIHGKRSLTKNGHTWLQRWENWICERGQAAQHLLKHDWVRVPLGKIWRSGNQAFTYDRQCSTS
jgi:hypothetical protein